MILSDIARFRLQNHRIASTSFKHAEEVVSWMGAMQAQDYAAAKWAVALRTLTLTIDDLDRALARGELLRTHILRPTWHFVTPADIRWMLHLIAPRIHSQNARYYRMFGLDDKLLLKTDRILGNAVQGGNHLTRSELGLALSRSGINEVSNNLRLAYIVLHAELEGIICSGALRGKQHTYGLLDERAPLTRILAHDSALNELTKRYFNSHGPATLKDFAWWSSIPLVEIKQGLATATQLSHETIDKQDYWFGDPGNARFPSSSLYLLPNYDEYIIGYSDRSAIFDQSYASGLDARRNPLFQHTIVVNGEILGTWKRTLQTQHVSIEASIFRKLMHSEQEMLAEAVARYGKFMNLEAYLKVGKAEAR